MPILYSKEYGNCWWLRWKVKDRWMILSSVSDETFQFYYSNSTIIPFSLVTGVYPSCNCIYDIPNAVTCISLYITQILLITMIYKLFFLSLCSMLEIQINKKIKECIFPTVSISLSSPSFHLMPMFAWPDTLPLPNSHLFPNKITNLPLSKHVFTKD